MVKIIAEIGVNHNGDLGLAKEMIAAAAACGADYAKFQIFDPKAINSFACGGWTSKIRSPVQQ